MFEKKVSEAVYNELKQKYLTFECAYNNEHQKCSELEKQIMELNDQIKKLQEYGNVAPDELLRRAEAAENQAKGAAELLRRAETAENQAKELLQLLEIEKNNTAQLTAKLQSNSGGNRRINMADITRWEYKSISNGSCTTALLNELGQEGWEAVGNSNGILFKRPLQPSNSQQHQQKNNEYYGYGR